MPSAQEILGFLVVIFVIFILLKVVRLAIRVILFIISLLLIAGAVWWFFVR